MVLNPDKLAAERLKVGSGASTVPVTSKYFGVASLPAWTIVPALMPSGALAAMRTRMVAETFRLLSGVSTIGFSGAVKPLRKISKWGGAVTVMGSVNCDPVTL